MRRAAVFACLAVLAIGLAVDVHVDLPGQVAIGLAAWAVLGWIVSQSERALRKTLMACVVIATAGELFLSLAWGLYTYRLGNVPMFVPPGHALLLVLGISLSERLTEKAANRILMGIGALSLALAATGIDTFGLALFMLLGAASISLPEHRRLYASTFLVALALELYGTALGNWTWERETPFIGLATTNPPFAAGAFYAALDALTCCAARLLRPALAPARETA